MSASTLPCGHPQAAAYAITPAPPHSIAVKGIHWGCEHCDLIHDAAVWADISMSEEQQIHEFGRVIDPGGFRP